MRRVAKDQRRRSKALTDPMPEFVSLVRTGANMTPFRVVKAEEEAVEEAIEVAKTEEAEEEVAVETVKSADYEVLKIVFEKAEFTEEATVKAWLDDGGYSDYTVEAKEDTFEVGELAEGREFREIKIKGAVVYVAHKLEVAEADRAEGTAAAVTGVKPVSKKSEEEPMLVPLAEDRRKSLYHVGEIASLVNYTRWLVEDLSYEVIYGDEEAQAPREAALQTLKVAGQALLSALAEIMGVEVGVIAETFKSEQGDATVTLAVETIKEEVAVEATVAVDAEKTEAVETVVEETAVEAEKTEEAETAVETVEEAAKVEVEPTVEVEKAADTSMAELMASVKTMADGFALLTKTVTDLQAASVAKSEQDESDRVSAEQERQSRKGADVDEVADAAIESVKTSQSIVSDLRLRSTLGIRNYNR